MQLIGMLDSPYVRRVAISADCLRIPFEHQPLSVFRQFDQIAQVSPLVKVPTWVLDDGTALVDSSLIIQHLEGLAEAGLSLEPRGPDGCLRAIQLLGVALAALEKTVFLIYERTQRPLDKQHAPWLERTVRQLTGACGLLEEFADSEDLWSADHRLMQTDITLAVAWRFIAQHAQGDLQIDRFKALNAFSDRAEKTPVFRRYPTD